MCICRNILTLPTLLPFTQHSHSYKQSVLIDTMFTNNVKIGRLFSIQMLKMTENTETVLDLCLLFKVVGFFSQIDTNLSLNIYSISITVALLGAFTFSSLAI